MFAWKQKAFSIPTRNELNNLWLRARKKVGSAERIYVPLDSAASKFAELSVQCYRTSTQPKWQFQPENAGQEGVRALISSDLSTVSAWISECLTKLRVVEISARRQMADGGGDISLWGTPDGSTAFKSPGAATGTFEALYTEHLPLPLGDADRNSAQNKVESYYWQGLITNSRWAGCHSLKSAAIINASQFKIKNGRLAINRSLLASSYELIRVDAVAGPAILKADALDHVIVRRKRTHFSQSNLNRKLKRSGRQTQIVYCLELLKLLGTTTTLVSIIKRSELAAESLLSAASILNRLGYIQLDEVDKADELIEFDRQDSSIDSSPSKDKHIAGPNTSSHNAISFVLIESQLSSTHRRLLKLASTIKGKDDTIIEAGEGQLLLALRRSKSTEAAHFVRRLRQTISKSNCQDFVQQSAPGADAGPKAGAQVTTGDRPGAGSQDDSGSGSQDDSSSAPGAGPKAGAQATTGGRPETGSQAKSSAGPYHPAKTGSRTRLIDSLFLSSIVCAPEDGVTVAELLGKARLALQVNKQVGCKWPNVTTLEPWEKRVIEIQQSRTSLPDNKHLPPSPLPEGEKKQQLTMEGVFSSFTSPPPEGEKKQQQNVVQGLNQVQRQNEVQHRAEVWLHLNDRQQEQVRQREAAMAQQPYGQQQHNLVRQREVSMAQQWCSQQQQQQQQQAEARKKETDERLKKYDSALAELFGKPILKG